MELSQVDPLLSDEEYDDYTYEGNSAIGCQLKQPVDMRDVVKEGATFQIEMNDEAFDEERQMEYMGEDVLEHVNFDAVGGLNDELLSEKTPFAALAEHFIDITPDGKVKKRIMIEGCGDVVPPNSLVWFHLNSYLEYSETPFDSTFMRQAPMMRRLGACECIAGLEIGLSTMKLREKAQFLIHYDLAYRKLGIPPRIPPESDILMIVTLEKYIDSESALRIGAAPESELSTLKFEEVYKGAKALSQEGNTAFSQKKYNIAIKAYSRALNSLEKVNKTTEEEEQQYLSLHLKLCTNLAVSCNKSNLPERAIVAARSAIYDNRKHGKAFYQLAVAHLKLGAHEDARKNACIARQFLPHNSDIAHLLKEIEKSLQLYNSEQVAFCKNMLKPDKKKNTKENNDLKDISLNSENTSVKEDNVDNAEAEDKEDTESNASRVSENESKDQSTADESFEISNCCRNFQLSCIEFIEDFVGTPEERDLCFPGALTYDEEKFIRQQARNNNLFVKYQEHEGRQTMFVSKFN